VTQNRSLSHFLTQIGSLSQIGTQTGSLIQTVILDIPIQSSLTPQQKGTIASGRYLTGIIGGKDTGRRRQDTETGGSYCRGWT